MKKKRDQLNYWEKKLVETAEILDVSICSACGKFMPVIGIRRPVSGTYFFGVSPNVLQVTYGKCCGSVDLTSHMMKEHFFREVFQQMKVQST